ncbi:MAG: hypothetical protein KC996_07250 [Phycisphaerales bacterium]|nr:hypothetical protein [Phycisphaerales bacterium]
MTTPLPPYQSNTQAQSYQFSAGGWVARVLGLILLLGLIAIGLVVGFIVAVPLIALAIVLYIYIRIRLFFKRAHDPNGPLDGRHNVKVIDRNE